MVEFDHHSARYNVARIVEELLLLEDHHARDRCIDCITKHYLRIIAYATEGLELPDSDVHPLLRKALELAQKHKSVILGILHGGPQPDPWSLIKEIRDLRKELIAKLYGVADFEHDGHHSH